MHRRLFLRWMFLWWRNLCCFTVLCCARQVLMYRSPQSHFHTQPWQPCSHCVCVCLIFSLAPLPSWEHSWHPEAQRGSNSGLKTVSHFRAGTLSPHQLSIPLLLLFGSATPRLPIAPERRILPWRMTSLRDGLDPFRLDSPRTQFPSAASTSGALPVLPSKNLNWQRT